MYRAWVVLLAGCGFQSSAAGGIAAPGPDAGSGTPMQDGSASSSETCWQIQDPRNANWSACTSLALPANIDFTQSVSIDTGEGDSDTTGFSCVFVKVDFQGSNPPSTTVCAVIADVIKIDSGMTLSAHGPNPLALFAHSIDIEGTIDVASHIGNILRGPGTANGCNIIIPATHGGGGAGGTFDSPVDNTGDGAPGGDQGGAPATAGKPAGTISTSTFGPGCDGGAGGLGDGAPPLSAGAAGGAIWIASDTGSLTLGPAAKINASGAGGQGGARANQGGSGGGSGGFIVLQAPSLIWNPTAMVFANGGTGGGGAQGDKPGDDGQDPTSANNDSANSNDNDGSGGTGYSNKHASQPGKVGGGGDDGGGGGGAGAIRIVTQSAVAPIGPSISPPAVRWSASP